VPILQAWRLRTAVVEAISATKAPLQFFDSAISQEYLNLIPAQR
jgi:hypothetical protein